MTKRSTLPALWLGAALWHSTGPSSTVLAAGAEDWPQFRGPGGAGVAAAGSRAPTEFGPQQHLAYRSPVPAGNSSPCIVGERIFLSGHHEGSLQVLALDRQSGRELWRHEEAPEHWEKGHELNGPASSTPVCDGQHLCVFFGSLGLLCFDLEGRERWRRPLPVVRNTFGSAASLVMHDGRLVFCNDQQEGSFLEVIEAASGATLWRKEREGFGSGWSTPMVWRRGEVDELVVYGVWWLSAYDLADGTERWAVPGLADEPCITPVHSEDLVFVSSYNMRTNPEVLGPPEFDRLLEQLDRDGDGRIDLEESRANRSVLSRADADGEGDHPLSLFFRMLDRDRDGGIEAEEWGGLQEWMGTFQHKNALVAVRPGGPDREPELAWQVHRGIPECPSPLVHEGRVYLVKNGGLATCLDAADGRLLYQERLDSGGPYYASPVVCDGRIYAASARGVVTVFATGDTLQILARNDLGERIMATPAFDGRRLFVRTERFLYAFTQPEGE